MLRNLLKCRTLGEDDDWLSNMLQNRDIPSKTDPECALDEACQGCEGDEDSFTIVTWNLWFSPFFWRERLAVALAEAFERDPDVLCFQEVTAEAHRAMVRCEFLQDRFMPTEYRLPCGYDCAVWVRRTTDCRRRLSVRSVLSVPLPTIYGRRGLFVDVEVSPAHGVARGGDMARRVRVVTSHLESGTEMEATRRSQLEIIFSRMHRDPFGAADGDVARCGGWDAAFFVGDFNLAPSYAENEVVGRNGIDLWTQLRPAADPGYTEDSYVNEMRYRAQGKHKQVRYDRIVLVEPNQVDEGRSRCVVCTPKSIRVLGRKPFDKWGEVWPSDHFGLAGTVVFHLPKDSK